MLQGTLNIQHPSLNLRPEFKRAYGQGTTTKVGFLDSGPAGLGAAVRDFCDFNTHASQDLAQAHQTYRAERAAEPTPVQSGPVLAAPPTSFQHLRAFRAEKNQEFQALTSAHSAQALQASKQVALTVAAWIGPALMTGCKDLGAGVLAVNFSRQTSQEGIQDSTQPLSALTGDQIVPGDRSRDNLRTAASDPNQAILFDSGVSSTVLIDSQTGFFALKSPT